MFRFAAFIADLHPTGRLLTVVLKLCGTRLKMGSQLVRLVKLLQL